MRSWREQVERKASVIEGAVCETSSLLICSHSELSLLCALAKASRIFALFVRMSAVRWAERVPV